MNTSSTIIYSIRMIDNMIRKSWKPDILKVLYGFAPNRRRINKTGHGYTTCLAAKRRDAARLWKKDGPGVTVARHVSFMVKWELETWRRCCCCCSRLAGFNLVTFSLTVLFSLATRHVDFSSEQADVLGNSVRKSNGRHSLSLND